MTRALRAALAVLVAMAHVPHEAPQAAPQAAPAAEPCAGLSRLEALTCQWKEESEKCIQQKCQDCSGDQCLEKCQKDTKLINECCRDNQKATTSPILCKSAALAEDINSCINSRCTGCAGEQCQVCKEDENTISKCCEGDYHNVELPEICGHHDESHSCSGLAGEERLTCSWGEEVRECMKTFCRCDIDDDACKLCQENMAQISMCCDQHHQSASAPRICTDAILTQDVMNCIDTSCLSCEGEQSCKLCKEDTNLVNQCCIDHKHGLPPPPMCQHISQLVLP